ncbi:MAG TPA: diguanylate cyclase, partial [Gammaproteobacteria bacterium]
SNDKRLLSPQQLSAELDDIFIKGFVGADRIDLARLRVYDTQLVPFAQSTLGLPQLLPTAPSFLLERARPRQGAERFKAIDGLWQGPGRPLYSLLVPIGGLHLSGYLEVVLDPLYNLGAISEMTKLPIRIGMADGKELFTSPTLAEQNQKDLLPVEYQLRAESGQPLYRITAYENNSLFYADLHSTQLGATIILIMLTVAMVLLTLYLLNRLLFNPIGNLISNVQHSMEGGLDNTIDERGVKEVHLLAQAFNLMAHTLHHNMSELQRISSLDGLTGIANRRAFDIRLEEEWARALRNRTPLALLIIDIDFFKAYNDSLGHQAGDHCLREVAQTLQNEMKRPGDLLARYGGEEFAVILPDTDIFGAGVVALNLHNALQQRAIPHPASTIAAELTLSIGVNALIPESKNSPEEFIGEADRALYEVKRNGRNSIGFAHSEKQVVAAGDARHLQPQ